MRFKNKYFIILLSFIVIAFLFITLGAELCHNHDDGDVHDDCFICKLVNNFVAALFHVIVFLTVVFFSCMVIYKTKNILRKQYYSSFSSRAPPLISSE